MAIPVPEFNDGLHEKSRRLLKAAAEESRRSGRDLVWTNRVIHAVWSEDPSDSPLQLYAFLLSMTRDWICRYPLFRTQGNFGSLDGDLPAGMRYNQIAVSPFGASLLGDPVPNRTRKKRKILPSFPNLLVNGAFAHSGEIETDAPPGTVADPESMEPLVSHVPTGKIRGGELLSFLPPHNLGEIARALLHLLDHPEATFRDLAEVLPGPDFPTGGIAIADQDLRQVYEKGVGSITVRAKAACEAMASGKGVIAVSELPYTETKDEVIEEFASAAKSGEYGWISDVRDMSSRESMRLEIEVRRGYDASRLLQSILQRPPLERRLSFKFLVRQSGMERIVPFLDLLRAYRDHRLAGKRGAKSEALFRKELARWIERSDLRRTQMG